jgi:sec-independent protein translocase protein TatC
MEQQTTKNTPPPETEKVMSFWDHLEELRWHIIRSVIAVVVLAIIAFLNREIVFDKIILAPSNSNFITNRVLCKIGEVLNIAAICIKNLHLQIINIKMSGQFMTHLYISTVAGFIAAFPYILFELWRFIRPALYEKEQKYSKGAVIISSLLFLTGVLFSYFLVVPLTVNFLGNYQVSSQVTNQVSLNSYINTVVNVTFGVGLAFELPILVYFLTRIGLITPDFLIKNRKYMFVLLLVLAAIITPPDMFSQILVVIPLTILYEASIKVSKRAYKKSIEPETS